ncbi:DUF2510 domain-containing protein [Cellulomonas endometrii]|uniref:DUF2510 domain-containing protein n=1 Tax=Cellulomonas endometrii TaxID=3036301 RepID=UPI0024ADFD66|nr:DUF2510 domain-containing protein [Cellulomonas endometrii]
MENNESSIPRSVPAGWYPDPDGALRWWDGGGWTERVAPTPGAEAAAAVVSAIEPHTRRGTAAETPETELVRAGGSGKAAPDSRARQARRSRVIAGVIAGGALLGVGATVSITQLRPDPFVVAVREEFPELVDVSDDQLSALGDELCAAYASAGDTLDVDDVTEMTLIAERELFGNSLRSTER